MSSLLPTLPPSNTSPVDALEQQNQSALQDALQQYQQAQANGIPGMAPKIAAAQSALQSYAPLPTTNAAPSSSGTSSNPLANAYNAIGGAISGTAKKFEGSLADQFYSSRLIILIIGLLLIAAGLFTFKTTQNVIQTSARLAA